VLVGGGIKGGQTIGKTDGNGTAVSDRPISIKDFMASVCEILGIDHTRKAEAPGGRPVRIVDEGAKPIRELVG